MLWIGKGGGPIERCNLNRAIQGVDEKTLQNKREHLYLHHETMNERQKERDMIHEKNFHNVIGNHDFSML